MLAEAWKADLNYLPSADPALAPHDLIEEEMKQAAEKAERDYNDSFESILDGMSWLFFVAHCFLQLPRNFLFSVSQLYHPLIPMPIKSTYC